MHSQLVTDIRDHPGSVRPLSASCHRQVIFICGLLKSFPGNAYERVVTSSLVHEPFGPYSIAIEKNGMLVELDCIAVK